MRAVVKTVVTVTRSLAFGIELNTSFVEHSCSPTNVRVNISGV